MVHSKKNTTLYLVKLQLLDHIRPGVGGGSGRQNCGQILNVIFRNFHPYRLWNRQLFGLLVMEQKLDPGVARKIILYIMDSNIYFWNEQTFWLMKLIKTLVYKSIQIILRYHVTFFKYFNDQITYILIFRLIFASDFKTIPFSKPCNFINGKNSSV